MANNNINQEQTRQNIVKLRKEHGYTQAKVAELMSGSRTIYNGIENGKVRLSRQAVLEGWSLEEAQAADSKKASGSSKGSSNSSRRSGNRSNGNSSRGNGNRNNNRK